MKNHSLKLKIDLPRDRTAWPALALLLGLILELIKMWNEFSTMLNGLSKMRIKLNTIPYELNKN